MFEVLERKRQFFNLRDALRLDIAQQKILPLWLDFQVVVPKEVEESIIFGVEDELGQRRQLGEDIPGRKVDEILFEKSSKSEPGRGCIFAASEPSSELSDGHQQVDVVGTHVVLGETDDGAQQGSFAMMVSRLLRHGASKLRHDFWNRP